MAKYKKRKDGRYQANICVEVDKTNNSRKFETIYAYSITELDNKKAEIKDRVNKGTYANDKGLLIKELAEKWYLTEKAVCGIRTKEMYERLTYKHIIPSIGEIRLKDLKKSDAQLMINQRASKHRTCQQLKMAVVQMLNFAMEDGLVYKNVASNIILPTKEKCEKRGLLDYEKEAIKNADFNDKERAFIYILLYSGIRRGEILALSKGDISIKAKSICIKNVVTFDISAPVFKSIPKTLSGIRTIPITEELEKVLVPYLNNLNSFYLFETEKGGLLPKSTYDDFWRRILNKINKAAGGNDDLKVVNGLSAHVFRHNYATMLYYAGVPIKDAQYLLGHSNIKITLDIYTHLDNSKSNIADKLKTISAL